MSSTVDESFLQQRMKEYSDRLESKSKLIAEVGASLDIATDVMEKIRLRKLTEDAEREREQIVEEMRKLESEIGKEQLQREKGELKKLADQHEISQSYEEAIEKWRMVHDLDPEDPSVEKPIKRLEGKLQRTHRLNNCIKQLTLRISEIKSVFGEVIDCLRKMEQAGKDNENILLIVEEFLQKQISAENFMMAWEVLLEQEPTKTPADQQPNYSALADRLNRGEIILFLGSDIPRLSGITELDLEELVKGLATKAKYKDFTGTLSMIAQYYEMSDYGRSSLVRNLNNLIEEKNIPEIKLYRLLARVEQPLVLISATYDMFLENCFRAAKKKYALISSVIYSKDNCRIGNSNHNLKAGSVIVCYSDQEEVRVLESGQDLSNLEDLKDYSLIYKIRGYYDNLGQDTWTLTEENYFDFARNIGNSIPNYIVRLFINRIVYFVGYSTRNWEDRLLISLILNLTRYESAKVITQTEDHFEIAYWRWKKVDIYPVGLENFVAQLENYLK